MGKANFVTGGDAFADWRDDLFGGEPPTLYRIADNGPLADVEIGPGRIALFGGMPGAGKTAFVMQAAVDALRISPTLRVVCASCEMSPPVLLDRQLARLGGVPLDLIRHRKLKDEHADRIDTGLTTIEGVADRLAFTKGTFSLDNIAATADAFAPLTGNGDLLLVVDYVQRLQGQPGATDKRGSVDLTMNHLRQFADAGAAVIVVSAVGRQRDKRGSSSYGNLNLASFKESGELEFGADDAFVMTMTDDDEPGGRILRHLKARHGDPTDIDLIFDGATQSFSAAYETRDPHGLQSALSSLWGSTDATEDETWT